jgi:hypothetical protein
MSELSSNYDPMSIHKDVDEIYTSPEMVEHARFMRSISQSAPQKRYINHPMQTINRPDLFGEYGGDVDKPPVAS